MAEESDVKPTSDSQKPIPSASGDSLSLSGRDKAGRWEKGTAGGGGLETRWKPGQSGNGRLLEAALKRLLSQVEPGSRETRYEAVMRTLATVAADERHPAWPKAVQMVLDRTDGAVAKTLRIEGELPLKVVVRGDRE